MEGLITPNQYYSRSPITKKMGLELAKMAQLEIIQFHDVKPDKETLSILNEIVFKNRKDITLRVYGYGGIWQDIGFLKHLPELEKLDWETDEFLSFQPLYDLKKLTHLGMGFLNPKSKISIKFLTDFKESLTSLNIHGDFKDLITTIPSLSRLTEVWFTSTKLNGFDFLDGLSIETIGNYGGKVASFDFLTICKLLRIFG